MTKISPLYQQHRQATGNHTHWQDRRQEDQRSQNARVRRLASQPGQHTGSLNRQKTAHAVLQLFSLLSVVQNSMLTPAISTKRADKLSVENKIQKTEGLALLTHRVSHWSSASGSIPDRRVTSLIAVSWPDACVSGLTPLLNPIATALYKASEFVAQYDPLKFPETEAAVIAPETVGIYQMKNDEVNREVFKSLTGRETLAGAGKSAMLPTILFFQRKTQQRSKRISQNTQEKLQHAAYEKYLANNCRIRTKTNQGSVVGDTLLVSGEMVRNPVRAAVEKAYISGTGKGEMPDWLVYTTEGTNIGFDIVLGIGTFGIYPAVKYTSAKGLTVAGQAVNGDNICLQREFSPEELANLLFDTEIGITDRRAFVNFHIHPKPAELKNVREFKPDGAFVYEHVGANLNTVEYMNINYQGTEYRIKEKAPGEYWTFHPDAVKPELVERRVYFDKENNKIHFNSEMPEGQGIDYQIVDGKNFIEMNGQNHELSWNQQKQKFEIILNKLNGEKKYVPVYKEPLSSTWHISTHNQRQVFSRKQEKIINRIGTVKNSEHSYLPENNLNPQYYGTGKIYHIEKTGDASHYPVQKNIEMNGKLVPVREKVTPEHGVHYEVYDSNFPKKKGYLVEWDGQRWLFEKPTSVHVSGKLKYQIDQAMYAKNVDVSKLSAPDHQGVRWDMQGNRYVKIKNKFVNIITKEGIEYFRHPLKIGKDIRIEFTKNKWHKAPLAQGYPAQLNHYPDDSSIATAYCTYGNSVSFALEKGKTLTQNLLKYFDPIDDGIFIDVEKIKYGKENLFSINKIVIDAEGAARTVYYPDKKMNRFKYYDQLFDKVPVDFDGSSKIIVTLDRKSTEHTLGGLHVLKQGTMSSCGYTCAAMVAKDTKATKKLSSEIIDEFVRLKEVSQVGIFSGSLSGQMTDAGIINNLVQVDEPVKYIKNKLRNNYWNGIVNIDGHFCIITSLNKRKFYFRDPYQGIMSVEKINRLNSLKPGKDIIEIMP